MKTLQLFIRKMQKMLVPCALLWATTLSAQQLYTSIDVLRPGKITFAPEAQHVLLVNNSVVQPHTYGHQIRLMDARPQNVEISADSAALFCLAGLAQSFDEVGYFASVSILDESQNNTSKFFEINKLTPVLIDSLCALYGADVVIALNRVVQNDVVTDFLTEYEDFCAALEVRSVANWSVHYPQKSQNESVVFADSLFWEEIALTRREAFEALPNRVDAIIDASVYAGRQAAARFLPRWETVDRYFYVNKDKLIKQGIDSVYYKKWEAAIALWQQAYDGSKNAKTRAYAAADMAVAYEILGNLEQAIEKANTAMLTFGTLSSYEAEKQTLNLSLYLQELLTRQKEIELLSKQM